MKVLNAEPLLYSQKAIQQWEKTGYKYIASSWDEIEKTEEFTGVTVLIIRLNRYVDSSVLIKFPDLKYLVSATTGHDHIDLNYIDRNNIKLISLKEYKEFLKTIPSTAEHTWALLMALIRKIPAANEHVRKGGWNRDLFRGYQLKNKVIGIIGLGRTGLKVANYAKVFDMIVQYYDPFVNNTEFTKCEQLPELFKSSDIITIHVHLEKSTENLIDKNNIALLKENALVINTSRGKVWDEEALALALRGNKILGIASDVLITELDEISKSPLWNMQQGSDNIIITPHIAGATYDAMWACEEFLAKSLI